MDNDQAELKVLHFYLQGVIASLPQESKTRLDKTQAALQNFLTEHEELGNLAVFLKFLELGAKLGDDAFSSALDSLADATE